MAGAAAKRYARAIFELAKDERQVEQWAKRLQVVRDVLTRPEVTSILVNPSIAVQSRQDLVTALLQEHVAQEGVNLGRLLVGASRVGDLDRIIEEYQLLADAGAGRVRAIATTAVPLSRSDADRLEQGLSRRLGRQVRLDSRVDRGIVGGLVLRIGDRVIDASVASRLQQLRRRLAGV